MELTKVIFFFFFGKEKKIEKGYILIIWKQSNMYFDCLLQEYDVNRSQGAAQRKKKKKKSNHMRAYEGVLEEQTIHFFFFFFLFLMKQFNLCGYKKESLEWNRKRNFWE